MRNSFGYIASVVVFMIVFTGSSVYAEQAVSPERHLFRAISKTGLEPNYSEDGELAWLVDASPGYGLLGAYQGGFFGLVASFISSTRIPPIAAVIGGAVIGGYLGSRVDATWEKGCVISGAVITTGLLLAFHDLKDIGK